METAALAPASVPFFRPNPAARLRLFCFPYAGGSAAVFRAWSRALAPHIEIGPVEPPGRGPRYREAALTSMDALVRVSADALLPLLDKPFAFYRHSLRGIVAYEIARLLERSLGVGPAHLVVSASRAPHVANPNPRIHHLPDEQFLASLQRYNGIPRAVLDTPDLLALLLPMVRADLTLDERYVHTPGPGLPCPISAFGGANDPWVR